MKKKITTVLAVLTFAASAFADVTCHFNHAISKNGDLIESIPGTSVTLKRNEAISNALDEIKERVAGIGKGFEDVCNIENIKKSELKDSYTWEYLFTLNPVGATLTVLPVVQNKAEFDDIVTKAWSEIPSSDENPVYSSICHYTCKKTTHDVY